MTRRAGERRPGKTQKTITQMVFIGELKFIKILAPGDKLNEEQLKRTMPFLHHFLAFPLERELFRNATKSSTESLLCFRIVGTVSK